MNIIRYFSFILILSLTVTFPPSSYARTARLPLSPKLLEGKTIYIANYSRSQKLADRAYDQLLKWGRFQVVPSFEGADLILLLSTEEYISGSYTYGSATAYGNYASYSGSTTVNYNGKTYITVINPENGEPLWSSSSHWGNLFNGYRSATRKLIKDLQKRVEENETNLKASLNQPLAH